MDCAFFRDFECEAGFSSEGVAGRLFSARSSWVSTLSSPLYVQNIVTYGYALPLKALTASAFFNNNSSAFKHPNFVKEAIEELLRKRCIDEHDNAPHVVNPLTVAEGKKLKFVLDLPYI